MVSRIAYRRGVARLIQTVVVIAFLSVFLSAADGIPNIDDEVIDRFTVLDILRIGIPALLIALVIANRPAIRDVVTWHSGRMAKVDRDPQRIGPAARHFGDRVFMVIAVIVAWTFTWKALPIATDHYPDYDWVLTVVVLMFVGLLLLALLGAYQALQPLLEVTGLLGGAEDGTAIGASSSQAASGVSAGSLLVCATCGTTSSLGTRFCSNCGSGLPEEAPAEPAEAEQAPAAACSQCAATLTPGNAFCTNCGHPVAAETS